MESPPNSKPDNLDVQDIQNGHPDNDESKEIPNLILELEKENKGLEERIKKHDKLYPYIFTVATSLLVVNQGLRIYGVVESPGLSTAISLEIMMLATVVALFTMTSKNISMRKLKENINKINKVNSTDSD